MKKIIFISVFICGLLQAQTKYAVYSHLRLVVHRYDISEPDGIYWPNPESSDTSYYMIDQECFSKNSDFVKDSITSFYDFVESSNPMSDKYWTIDVHSFKNTYNYVDGIGIYPQIIQFLIRRKIKMIS